MKLAIVIIICAALMATALWAGYEASKAWNSYEEDEYDSQM